MLVLAACSLGGAGHLRPLVPLLDAARAAGHETLVAGPPALADLVAAAGHPFAPGGEPAQDEVTPIREQLPVLPAAEAALLGNRELFGRLATAAMLEPLDAIVRDRRPDLVLREPCEHASVVVARRHGLPVAQVAIGLAAGEWGAIDLAAPAVAAFDAGAPEAERAMPYLTALPASVDPSPFPHTVRFRAGDGASAAEPLPDRWAGSDAPLVYVTFGTVLGHMRLAGQVLRTAIEAVAGVDARVLVTTGPTVAVETLGPLPAHVHAERWIDQARVLATADAVLCHGGSGTAYGALAAGVPVVCVPVFADQFTNGQAIAAAGAGLVVADETAGAREPIGPHRAPEVRRALERVLAEPAFRARAEAVAANVARAPDAAAALACVSRGG